MRINYDTGFNLQKSLAILKQELDKTDSNYHKDQIKSVMVAICKKFLSAHCQENSILIRRIKNVLYEL